MGSFSNTNSNCRQWSKTDVLFSDCASCTFANNGDTLTWTSCNSALHFDGTTCETSCPRGKYTSTSYHNDALGIYNKNTCTACQSPCSEWVEVSKWTSCVKDYYLKYESTSVNYGSCTQKDGTSDTLEYFVRPNYEPSTSDGSYGSPFGNIAYALAYANDQAAAHASATINIYLLGGDTHYMTRNTDHFQYDYENRDEYGYNQDITIQPAFWGKTLGGHAFGSSDSDCIATSAKLTVSYKMGNDYQFVIPKTMTIKNIIFDALESGMNPTYSWFQKNRQCCSISGTTISTFALNGNAPQDCNLLNVQTEEWVGTFGRSLFQFGYHESLSVISGVGTLTITSCIFQNFYHDMNSLIGLNNGHGKVVISDTEFDKFSNCGSIIRDTQQLPSLDYVNKNDKNIIATYRGSKLSIDQINAKIFKITNTAWSGTTCADIKISSSTFTNFNYLKTATKAYHKVEASSKMVYQGLILNLVDFQGNIYLNGNTFTSVQFKYSTCEDKYTSGTSYEADTIFNTGTILQAKTLIYVNVKNQHVEITDNTFTSWNSLLGLIYLNRVSTQTGLILIKSNTFSKNSALLGANVLKLNLWTSAGYKVNFSSSSMVCAGVEISSNTFTQNIGWFGAHGTMQLSWYTDGDTDPTTQETHDSNSAIMGQEIAENLCISGITSFTTVASTALTNSGNSIDSNKFLLKSNTYTENFSGQGSGLIYIRGVRRLHMESETFTSNSAQYKEALDKYGSITSSGSVSVSNYPGAWSIYAYFGVAGTGTTIEQEIATESQRQNYYPIAPLTIDGGISITLTSLTFDNNALIELLPSLYTTTYPSETITIRRSMGTLSISSLTIRNYKGLDLGNLSTILGSEYSNAVTVEPNARSTDTVPTSQSASPKYDLDFGFKFQIMLLAVPDTESASDFGWIFNSITFNTVSVSNMTRYTNENTNALFLSLDGGALTTTITDATFTDIDSYFSTVSLVNIESYKSVSISNFAVTNLNKNAYNYDTSAYSYTAATGGVFHLKSFASDGQYGEVTYSFNTITLNGIYGKSGIAFFVDATTGVSTPHARTIAINTLVARNSFSYTNPLVYLNGGAPTVTITGSTFESNTGVKGAADLYLKDLTSLTISSTAFKLFSSSASSNAQSIIVTQSKPYSYTPTFNSVTIMCLEDSAYSNDTYVNLLNDISTNFPLQSPINVASGQIQTSSCTFKNWRSGTNGGIMYIGDSSIITDTSSTFTQNAASKGAAIYSSKGQINLDSTTFSKNYATEGGALFLDNFSTTGTFQSVSFTSNYVSTHGGGITAIASSTITITS